MNVFDAIMNRRSVRSYSGRAIPEDVLARMLQVLRAAPSACNYQPWQFVVVLDRARREQLARACREQMWMADAPVIIAGCGLAEKAYKRMGGHGNSVDIDLAIAIDQLTLAATAEGLGTCWIGAFTEQDVKDLLGVPAEAKVVALTPLGYPASPDAIRPLDDLRRRPIGEVVSLERFANPWTG